VSETTMTEVKSIKACVKVSLFAFLVFVYCLIKIVISIKYGTLDFLPLLSSYVF